jgi:hypothetical protein
MAQQKTPIRVAELFAGVGGFRLGFERASSRFETVFSSQWEPPGTTKKSSAPTTLALRSNAASMNRVLRVEPDILFTWHWGGYENGGCGEHEERSGELDKRRSA